MPTPQIETRTEQPYVAVAVRLAMTELAGLGPRLHDVFTWLGARGLRPVGAPFFKYDEIDMTRELVVEVGVPIGAHVAGDEHIVSGVLPAGRYATLLHVGHPSRLEQATASLLKWADEQGLRWDATPGEQGEIWGSRLEIYLTDPDQEPDMDKWAAQLAFRLAD